MHVELVDLFRCTSAIADAHPDSWLVAAAFESADRVIVNGVLGCPLCGAEYPIVDGVTEFSVAENAAEFAADDKSAPDENETFRLAAQLDLSTPDRTIALVGYELEQALALLRLVSCRIVLVNGSRGPAAQHGATMARISCGDLLPIANAALHGIATRFDRLPHNAVQLLRAGGRMVAPAGVAIPEGTSEIARDHREWVIARDAVASAPVRLSRRQPSE